MVAHGDGVVVVDINVVIVVLVVVVVVDVTALNVDGFRQNIEQNS